MPRRHKPGGYMLDIILDIFSFCLCCIAINDSRKNAEKIKEIVQKTQAYQEAGIDEIVSRTQKIQAYQEAGIDKIIKQTDKCNREG